jgi:hypothetical protein
VSERQDSAAAAAAVRQRSPPQRRCQRRRHLRKRVASGGDGLSLNSAVGQDIGGVQEQALWVYVRLRRERLRGAEPTKAAVEVPTASIGFDPLETSSM